MAKAFSEKERMQIKERLKESAITCLEKGSMRALSVDALSKEAGISKGAFYIFYDSKEELFFEVITEYHEEAEVMLTEQLSLPGPKGPNELTRILFATFKAIEASFLPKLLAGRELELLMRKLPNEVIESHQTSDASFLARICSMVPSLEGINTARYSAAFRGIFLLLLHKQEIGEDFFEDVLQLLISGVVRDMFGEVNA